MTISIVEEIHSEEYGMTAVVTQDSKDFYVRLRDDDAGEFFPFVHIYKTKDSAIVKAKEILH
jgi:hypothetical protein